MAIAKNDQETIRSNFQETQDIFLPMTGRFLLPQKDNIVRQLQAFDVSPAQRKWYI